MISPAGIVYLYMNKYVGRIYLEFTNALEISI